MKTGLIGLGAMGMHMARNLHRGGSLVGVWNRTVAKSAALAAELNLPVFHSPAGLAQRCEAIVICVSADADLRSVVTALLPGLAAGTLVMDCSTVSANTAREMSALLALRGVSFLDCPVSGGVEGARLATLAIMVGSDATSFERARPVLQQLGRAITRFGDCGAGQAANVSLVFLEHGHRHVVLEELIGRRQPGRAGSHDHHVFMFG